MTDQKSRVVVVGAGFAGSSFMRGLPQSLRRPGETLLVERSREYPFIPLIHEVAVGRIHPDSVRYPVAELCKGGCEFLNTTVTGVDLDDKKLETDSGTVGYEYLVLATGSGAAAPPENLAEHFQLFWSLDDALELRGKLSESWHGAMGPGAKAVEGDLTVAIVGGGATGVELAAEIATLFQYLKKRNTRSPAIVPRVVLLEATDRLLGWLDPYFHEVALEELEKLGVEVRFNSPVEEADEDGVKAGDEWLPARIKVWTTGIKVPGMIRNLPGEHDPTGRIKVDARLNLPEYPEVYVLGDAGVHEDTRHGPLPPTASTAVQQGPWAARDIVRRISGHRRPAFDFFNRGYVVSLGPESAVGEAVGVKLSGVPAQALYRSIFLYYLKRTRDRTLTGADWAMERTVGRVGFGSPRRRRPAKTPWR